MSKKLTLFNLLSWPILIIFYFNITIAFPISKYFSNHTDPEYIKLYFKKMYSWHCKNYFDFEKHWSPNEKKLFDLWLESLATWGVNVEDLNLYENFKFSHNFKSNKLNSSAITLAAENWSKPNLDQVKKVLSDYKINFDNDEAKNFNGLNWDFLDKKIGIISIITKENRHLSIYSKLKQFTESKTNQGWSYPILQNRIIDLKTKAVKYEWHFTLKKVDWDLLPNKVALDISSVIKVINSDSDTSAWIYRVKSMSPLVLDEAVHLIVKNMSKQFNAHPDYIQYNNKSDFILLYP